MKRWMPPSRCVVVAVVVVVVVVVVDVVVVVVVVLRSTKWGTEGRSGETRRE